MARVHYHFKKYDEKEIRIDIRYSEEKECLNRFSTIGEIKLEADSDALSAKKSLAENWSMQDKVSGASWVSVRIIRSTENWNGDEHLSIRVKY